MTGPRRRRAAPAHWAAGAGRRFRRRVTGSGGPRGGGAEACGHSGRHPAGLARPAAPPARRPGSTPGPAERPTAPRGSPQHPMALRGPSVPAAPRSWEGPAGTPWWPPRTPVAPSADPLGAHSTQGALSAPRALAALAAPQAQGSRACPAMVLAGGARSALWAVCPPWLPALARRVGVWRLPGSSPSCQRTRLWQPRQRHGPGLQAGARRVPCMSGFVTHLLLSQHCNNNS